MLAPSQAVSASRAQEVVVARDPERVPRRAALREWEPSPHVLRAVASIWYREPQSGDILTTDQVIVPDNCADIVVLLDDQLHPARAYVVGPMTRPLAIADRQPARYAGIRFKSGWISRILRINAGELRDARVALTDVLPGARGILESAFKSVTDTGLLGQLAAVAERLDSGVPPDGRVLRAVERVEQTGGRISISRLASEVNVTRQHLARMFDANVGVTPKFAARVARIRRVLATASRTGVRSWSAVALEAGFADQPHLVHDFSEFTGRSPTEWFRAS
jgi:AraC-like DNA-binding protein